MRACEQGQESHGSHGTSSCHYQAMEAMEPLPVIIKRWKLIWFGNVTRHLRRRCRESGLKEDFSLSVEGTVDGDGE